MQSVSEAARLETNPNPKWAVPKDVIEWQPAYTQKVCAKSLHHMCSSHGASALGVLVESMCQSSYSLTNHKSFTCRAGEGYHRAAARLLSSM